VLGGGNFIMRNNATWFWTGNVDEWAKGQGPLGYEDRVVVKDGDAQVYGSNFSGNVAGNQSRVPPNTDVFRVLFAVNIDVLWPSFPGNAGNFWQFMPAKDPVTGLGESDLWNVPAGNSPYFFLLPHKDHDHDADL
jgi:hypothetical protein